MAASTSSVKRLEIDENNLICGICCERYKNPKILPCLHTFCEQCLVKLVKDAKLLCPFCRREHQVQHGEVATLSADLFTEDLMKQFAEANSLVCGACRKQGETPTTYCLDCGFELCGGCVGIHGNIPVTQSHNLVTLDEYQRRKGIDPTSVRPPTFCCKHSGTVLRFHCTTCDVAICSECVATDHLITEHTYISLQDAAADVTEKLTAMVEMLASKEDEASDSIAGIQQMAASLAQTVQVEERKINEHVEKTLKELTSKVKGNGKQLLEELKQERGRRQTRLQAQLKEMEGVQEDILHVREFAERLVNHGSPVQVMSARKGVLSQGDRLLAIETNQSPIEDDSLKFQQSDDFCADKRLGHIRTTMYRLSKIPDFGRIGDEIRVILEMGTSTATINDVIAEIITPGKKIEILNMCDNGDGTVSLMYTGKAEGNHELSVSVYKRPIQGSPVKLKIIPRKGWSHEFCHEGSDKGQLNNPHGITMMTNGNMLVCDSDNNRLQTFTIDGLQVAVVTYTNFTHAFCPRYAAVAKTGYIYITDSGNKQVIVCDNTLKWIRCFGEDELVRPMGIGISPTTGRSYIVDGGRHCIHIYGPDDIYIKSFGSEGSEHGQFESPWDIVIMNNGNIIVSDCGNDRLQVFSEDGEFLLSFGSDGSENGQLVEPEGLALDNANNLYVCEYSTRRVQKFNSKCEFDCIAISENQAGNHDPRGICITNDEPLGKVIVSECWDRHCISVYNQ
ncbi:tripartite motif-containing protein 2-like [Glandiceps talaboti]